MYGLYSIKLEKFEIGVGGKHRANVVSIKKPWPQWMWPSE